MILEAQKDCLCRSEKKTTNDQIVKRKQWTDKQMHDAIKEGKLSACVVHGTKPDPRP